jgi:hypothetical protein
MSLSVSLSLSLSLCLSLFTISPWAHECWRKAEACARRLQVQHVAYQHLFMYIQDVNIHIIDTYLSIHMYICLYIYILYVDVLCFW